jgi:protein translocase SecG subunit
MLVVLLQAGRGGGIGLAFGGSGGSQSVFGSSGGATFLTKLTAVCAILFMTNSLVLAYMSSQSDSRRLERIATKKAQDKKAEDAANVKMLTDIEKQREAKDKAAAQKSEAEPAEGAPGEDKAEDKAPVVAGKASDEKPNSALKLTLPPPAGGKPVAGAPGKLAADLKLGKPGVQPAAQAKPGVQPAAQAKPGVQPAAQAKPAVQPAAQAKPAVQPAAQAKPAVQPAAQAKPAVQPKQPIAKKPVVEKKSDENSAEKPAAE